MESPIIKDGIRAELDELMTASDLLRAFTDIWAIMEAHEDVDAFSTEYWGDGHYRPSIRINGQWHTLAEARADGFQVPPDDHYAYEAISKHWGQRIFECSEIPDLVDDYMVREYNAAIRMRDILNTLLPVGQARPLPDMPGIRRFLEQHKH